MSRGPACECLHEDCAAGIKEQGIAKQLSVEDIILALEFSSTVGAAVRVRCHSTARRLEGAGVQPVA
eukprot:1971519-Pyramimonas_sp.AAC.1